MYKLPKPKKVKPKVTEETLLLERIHEIRLEFDYKKKKIQRKLKYVKLED